MYDAQDLEALLREHPRFTRPSLVKGPNLTFRNAVPDDAEFILSLRLDPNKNEHLSKTSPDLTKQREWLSSYSDLYFIIETNQPIGTVRLYDQRGTSFSWGSWILSDAAPRSAAIESTMMVYDIGLDMGFCSSHFEVRKGNEKVWRYHERLGAERVGETEADYLYKFTKRPILAMLDKFKIPVEAIW